jgi:tRNA-2-methylthio-N6-dimethylallyladenosine synthase
MPSVFIKTYGCQMNERDSEQVLQQLAAKGYELATTESSADVILLNTCSVRDMAEQNALNKMKHLQGMKKKNPKLVLGFLGCMAQSRGQSLVDSLPDVDLVVGTQKFHQVADYVDQLVSQGSESIVDIAEETESQNTIRDHVLKPKQVTAFVSIMQGCNMHCTFCIVPFTRGPERSRPIAEIVQEVKMLAANGVKEVTLLGQIVNLYGRHEFPKVDGKSPFVQLLEAVAAVPGIHRVRFTSPHPIGYRKDLIEAFKTIPELCEHVHLPLQSGSNRILKTMHRAYTREHYLKLVDEIRTAHPDVGLTTDVIVGFPGETEEDFQQTKSLMKEVGFDQAFIFRYSPRKDTPAAEMGDQHDEETKLRWNQELLEVLNSKVKEKSQAMVGQEIEILVEGESKYSDARFEGRTRGNKLVLIEANERWRGEILKVRITESTGFTLYAEPVIQL